MEIIDLNVKNSNEENPLLVYEFDKNDFFKFKGSLVKLVGEGLYTIWDDKRIKSAFNFGNGTYEDFIRFVKDNRIYCAFYFVNQNFIIC